MTGYFDVAYAAKVTIYSILALLAGAWLTRLIVAAAVTLDHMAAEAEHDRIVDEDETKILARVAFALDEMDERARERLTC